MLKVTDATEQIGQGPINNFYFPFNFLTFWSLEHQTFDLHKRVKLCYGWAMKEIEHQVRSARLNCLRHRVSANCLLTLWISIWCGDRPLSSIHRSTPPASPYFNLNCTRRPREFHHGYGECLPYRHRYDEVPHGSSEELPAPHRPLPQRNLDETL